MSKAFINENNQSITSTEDLDELLLQRQALPVGMKNYITHTGYYDLRKQYNQLLNDERPKLVKQVAWAASNGDRSENADYLYGKRRLREIDRRLHFIEKRLSCAEIVDTRSQEQRDKVFFGATVCFREFMQQPSTAINQTVVEQTTSSNNRAALMEATRAVTRAATRAATHLERQQISNQPTQIIDLNNLKTVTLVGVDEVNSECQKISWISPIAQAMLGKSIGETVFLRVPEGVKTLEIVTVSYPN